MKTIGYAALSPTTRLTPFEFDRRDLRPTDIAVDVLYCGMCHSDLHQCRNDWGRATYPLVPGHEIVGCVVALGSEAQRHRIGDVVAIGALVDSCQECPACLAGEVQQCREWATQTYADRDRETGEPTQGGYSRLIVLRESFAFKVPEGLDLARVGPILCAGSTTWSPLRHAGIGPGSRVAVAGLGGLGHMAIKLAVALGAEVTVVSRSADKDADARELGAHGFLLSSDPEAMKASARAFDMVLDTIPVRHDVDPLVRLLDNGGQLVIAGYVGPLDGLDTRNLMTNHRSVTACTIGGLQQHQELLDFCAHHGVMPDCEIIGVDQIADAFERMERSDVRYRFVIDLGSLPVPA